MFLLDVTNLSIWTPNAIRLKAYSDRGSNYYDNGQLSDFEYLLQTFYRSEIFNKKKSFDEATILYQKDIIIYRTTYFVENDKNQHSNEFFLSLQAQPNDSEFYKREYAIYQAQQDASLKVSNDLNIHYLKSIQAYFNRKIENNSTRTMKKLLDLLPNEQKKDIQEARIVEEDFSNEFIELFNLYIYHYSQTRNKYLALTNNHTKLIESHKIDDYKLTKFFDIVEEPFELSLYSSLSLRAQEASDYYNKFKSNQYYINTENRIRDFYQDKILSIITTKDMTDDKSQLQEYSCIEEYKEKIQDFRHKCGTGTDYIFPPEIPYINKYQDYSFSISKLFIGLDTRTVIENAITAAKNEDYSIYNIEWIRSKISEFININCMDADQNAEKEINGRHEVNVIMENYGMNEQRLLLYLKRLITFYSKYFISTLEKKDTSKIKYYEKEVIKLNKTPVITYFDNKLEISSLIEQLNLEKEDTNNEITSAYLMKIQNATQQKIFDINDIYNERILHSMSEYVETGDAVKLNNVFQNLVLDINRLLDEFEKFSKHYNTHSEVVNKDDKVEFDLGKYYYFKTKQKSRR
jgi:hypothetical protein